MTHETPAMAQAWDRYCAALERARERLYGLDICTRPGVLASAHYALHQVQATAFNLAIGPRPAYPRFDIHLFSEPMVYPWLLNNPDFLYRMVWLDGARRHRVWGTRGDTCWMDFQVFSRFWTEPETRMKTIGNYDLDKFEIGADGSFEILLSAQRQDGNWIALDPDSPRHAIMVREAFVDWERDNGVALHIEAIDDGTPAPVHYDEAAMIERVDAACRLIDFTVGRWMTVTVPQSLAHHGLHKFFQPGVADDDSGLNPEAYYWMSVYEIGPDDALIIEAEVPDCLYWGVQLTDAFVGTAEYVHHQGSLNGHQAEIDADGIFRAVLSLQDPGVPNWLDPAGKPFGTIFLRWYRAANNAVPRVRCVPFASLRDHLPDNTAVISPTQRAATLARRRDGANRRYHY